MPATRSSARLAAASKSSQESSQPSGGAGSKHKTDSGSGSGSSPAAKRSKKEQKTIEETISKDEKPAQETGASAGETKAGEAPVQDDGVDKAMADVEMKEPEKPAINETKAGEAPTQDNGVDGNNADVDMKDPGQAVSKEDERPQEPAKPESKPEQETVQEKEAGKTQEPTEEKAQEQAKLPTKEKSERQPENKSEDKPLGLSEEKPQEKSGEESKEPVGQKTEHSEHESKSAEKPNGAVEQKSEAPKHEEKPEDKLNGAAEERTAPPKHEETAAGSTTNGNSAIEPKAREGKTPSNILEKGIIYFFFRGRVGIEDPTNVNDIARSYIIMRPLPHDAKLGDGPIGDGGNSRLLALPKKVLPTSGKDRFMTFVEKTHTSFKQLKDEFLSASDYETKTAGVRHTPAATPVGEGIYSITSTGRENHLAYILTIPSGIGEVQKDMGLRERGSFVISTRNPAYDAPSNASLPEGPSYPQDIMDSFRSLRWQATVPKHLDFVNTQFLLIGESKGLDSATQQQDGASGQEAPKEEMEKLEAEDEHRVEGLKGDESAAIFADLEVTSKGYHGLQTTWAD